MKRIATLCGVFLAAFLLLANDADARRLGGGGSLGRQSPNVMRQAAPAPAPQAAPQAAPRAPAQAQPAPAPNVPPAQPARNRWLGPIAGLAAGIGLAALASHFGFGEELASMMLIALVAFAGLVVFKMLMARRTAPGPSLQPAYSPSGVGAEASIGYAPPIDRNEVSHTLPSASAAPESPAGTWRIPEGFDVDSFVNNAKTQFVRLQAAYDAAALTELQEYTTADMFAELKAQIAGRSARNHTDVVKLDAELLGIESDDREHLASIRFRGLVREDEGAPAQDFDEVWNLTKPAAGGGWVLAGIQQLQ